MKTDKKDKLIIVLVIGIVLILAKDFKDNNNQVYIAKRDETVNSMIENQETIENNKINIIKKVHISGEINKAGVYEIDDNDRLENLVDKAGGLTDKADINAINLSMILEDQMRIIIPNINDTEKIYIQNSVIDSNTDKKININTATKEELMTLPNIGENRAQSIIDYREVNKFQKLEDIKNVSGIGDKYFERMKELIKIN